MVWLWFWRLTQLYERKIVPIAFMKKWRPYLHVILFKHIIINQGRGGEGQRSQTNQRRGSCWEKHWAVSHKIDLCWVTHHQDRHDFTHLCWLNSSHWVNSFHWPGENYSSPWYGHNHMTLTDQWQWKTQQESRKGHSMTWWKPVCILLATDGWSTRASCCHCLLEKIVEAALL